MVAMRDVCARFKYREPDGSCVSLDPHHAASFPHAIKSKPTDGPNATTTATTTLPRSNEPSRELIHKCLQTYYRHMEAKTMNWTAVSQQIHDDLAPYSILKLGGFSLGNICTKILAHVLIMSSSQLKTLDLGFNRITDKGAILLAKALERNRSLERLYLSGNEIGPRGAAALAKALTVNRTLQSLHLSGNNIGEDGAKAIADGLKTNQSLRALYLGTNGIGANGMQSLADALHVNTTLEELTLGQNKIGNQGVRWLAKMFANPALTRIHLTTLELGMNHIDHEGALLLAKALAVCPHRLQNLYIDNNPIGDVGASVFGALLAKNRVLRVLDVSYTQLSILGLRELSVGLSYSPSLVCLVVDGHDWASTKYMNKTTHQQQFQALQGTQLSTKGANQYAASCIVSAVTSNAYSVLYKLTGVDLSLGLASLPVSPTDRESLVLEQEAEEQETPTSTPTTRRRQVDLCTRNERILKFLRENRRLFHNHKRKSVDRDPTHPQTDTTAPEPEPQRLRTEDDRPTGCSDGSITSQDDSGSCSSSSSNSI